MPFHPFCSQGQNEQNAANAFRTKHSHSRIVKKKSAQSDYHIDCGLVFTLYFAALVTNDYRSTLNTAFSLNDVHFREQKVNYFVIFCELQVAMKKARASSPGILCPAAPYLVTRRFFFKMADG